MKQTRQSAVVANLIADDVSTPEEREAFDRDVAKLIAESDLINMLEEARVAQDLTKQEVADRMGVKRSVVSRLLSGRRANPQLRTIADLADAMDVYLDITVRKQPKNGAHRAPIRVH